jgi:hypothetical protein
LHYLERSCSRFWSWDIDIKIDQNVQRMLLGFNFFIWNVLWENNLSQATLVAGMKRYFSAAWLRRLKTFS